MRIATPLAYAADPRSGADAVADWEQDGLDVVWVAEAYGFDAPTIMGYLAAKTTRLQIGSAILPIYSRTPALLAQTAAGLDAISGGRAILGLGASGPQVIEGWHGVAYDRPLGRTREVIGICRQVWRRETLIHDGIYRLPLPAGEGTGLGKPLKILTHPVRDRIPIYVASLGDKNVRDDRRDRRRVAAVPLRPRARGRRLGRRADGRPGQAARRSRAARGRGRRPAGHRDRT